MRAALVFLLIFCFFLRVSGQSANLTLDDYLRLTDTIAFSYPSEKVYLHFDKPFYAPGQTIWFKSYVTDGSNQPSMASAILYVDFIDAGRKILKSLKMPLSAGLGWGNMVIPDSLTQKGIRVRAYTNWMRNFGDQSFFDYNIPLLKRSDGESAVKVTNPFKATSEAGHAAAKNSFVRSFPDKVSVGFFPEGGQLVEAVRSKVAFKVVGSSGLGIAAKGYIRDNSGNRVAEFSTEFAGMGSFMLTPFQGQKYTAIINLPQGEQVFDLPAAIASGYVMTASDSGNNNLLVRVTASADIPLDDRELTLAILGNNQVPFVSTFKMTRQFAEVLLPTSYLRTGVAQLTLFNKDKLPVAERLFFLDNNYRLDLKISSDKADYGLRELVKMELKALDANSKPVAGSFSVSVTNIGNISLAPENEKTILSELLLESELKGYIESPHYYFLDISKVRRKQLDNLLLTQGWRRIHWTQHLPELIHETEKGIVISGQILRNNMPVADGTVMLFTPGGGVPMDTLTNAEGRFTFNNLAFADSTRFVVQGRTEKDRSNVTLLLDPISRPDIGDIQVFEAHDSELANVWDVYSKSLEDELAEMVGQGLNKQGRVLDEVVVKATRDVKPTFRSSKLGNAPADYTFASDQLSGANIADALVGKILGLDQIQDIAQPRAVFVGLRRNKLLSGIPMMRLFVDGVDVGSDLSIVNIADIATVEIMKGGGGGAAIYGDAGFAGVIIVTTKGYAGIQPIATSDVRGIISYTPPGFTISREFYSPDYSDPKTPKDKADFRSTIYWNPDLFSQESEIIPFDFFTSDKPGKYRVVIEGLDNRGRLGHSVHTFTVK